MIGRALCTKNYRLLTMDDMLTTFKATLAKFKFTEFPDVLARVFGKTLTWKKVARKLEDLRLDRRSKTVAGVCCMMYKETGPTREEMLKTLRLLQLYEISVHNRKWFGIKLKEPFPDSPPSFENIKKTVTRAYKKELKTAKIYKTVAGDVNFIMVVEEKETKKGLKYSSPVFFAYNVQLNQPYAFYSPKLSKTYPLDCFSSAVGYQSYRLLALSGSDIHKLFSTIQRKHDGTVALRAPLLPIVPVTFGNITDMTGYSARRKYAVNVLPGRTDMKAFTVQSENEWRGTSVIPSLRTECVIRSSISFQAKKKDGSVEDVLREMIAQGNIKTPLPSWLQKFSQQPRNTIKLYSRDAISSSGAFERTNNSERCSNDENGDCSMESS